MQDRIIEGYLKDFAKNEDLEHLSDTEAFERFINFCVISRDHPETFDVEEISIGGGGDLGIDGVAVLVNEHLASSTEDVDFFKKQLRRLDVRFVFVQSKTSSPFDSGEIGNFLFGVRTFFKEPAVENDKLKRTRAIKEYIYTIQASTWIAHRSATSIMRPLGNGWTMLTSEAELMLKLNSSRILTSSAMFGSLRWMQMLSKPSTAN